MNDFTIHRILVPTDLSPQGLIALRYARHYAERFSATVTLLYVDPIFLGASVGFGAEIPVYANIGPDYYAQLEREVRQYAAETFGSWPYEVAATAGRAATMVVQEAQERGADLIVMAPHGVQGWQRAVLGSVTEGVRHGGTCPVLSIPRSRPAEAPVGVKRILCPVNFSDIARRSLDYAAHLAAAFGCELTAVHVSEVADPLYEAVLEKSVRAWIEPSVVSRCAFREIALRGDPAERVLACAEEIGADLLVVGAQHKVFRDIATTGTTTEHLVRLARIPLLTVPEGAAFSAPRRERELAAQLV